MGTLNLVSKARVLSTDIGLSKVISRYVFELRPELNFKTLPSAPNSSPSTTVALPVPDVISNGGPALAKDELDSLIDASSEAKLAEVSGILLDLKHRMYPPQKKKFSFDF